MLHSVSPIDRARPLSPQKFTLWKDYIRVLARVSKQLDSALRTQVGVKLEDYKIMMVLADYPGESAESRITRMGEISQALSCSPSKLTYQIDKLIDKGWVERSDVDYDRRGKGVLITPAGLEKYLEASKVREQQLDRFLFRFLTPDEVEIFGSILHKIGQEF